MKIKGSSFPTANRWMFTAASGTAMDGPRWAALWRQTGTRPHSPCIIRISIHKHACLERPPWCATCLRTAITPGSTGCSTNPNRRRWSGSMTISRSTTIAPIWDGGLTGHRWSACWGRLITSLINYGGTYKGLTRGEGCWSWLIHGVYHRYYIGLFFLWTRNSLLLENKMYYYLLNYRQAFTLINI